MAYSFNFNRNESTKPQIREQNQMIFYHKNGWYTVRNSHKFKNTNWINKSKENWEIFLKWITVSSKGQSIKRLLY